MAHYFDTHAILGILAGEPRYRNHGGIEGYTHHVNILEALVKLIQRGRPDPRAFIETLGLGLVHATDDDLLVAALMKTNPALRKSELSLVDALGYAVARRMKIPFLTGDPGFEHLPGVDFVKS